MTVGRKGCFPNGEADIGKKVREICLRFRKVVTVSYITITICSNWRWNV